MIYNVLNGSVVHSDLAHMENEFGVREGLAFIIIMLVFVFVLSWGLEL
jgi:hypothetical protein